MTGVISFVYFQDVYLIKRVYYDIINWTASFIPDSVSGFIYDVSCCQLMVLWQIVIDRLWTSTNVKARFKL